MTSRPEKDPYQFYPEEIQTPPSGLLPILRRIGPGVVLSASIVGSGELIATTTLGAQVGYAALWLIVLSCLAKVFVQAELGRYTIASGETGLEAFNRVPGPRWQVGWVVWMWAFIVFCTLLQVGAMYGGVSQVLNLVFPSVPVNLWVVLCMGLTIGLLLGGGYARIEHFATFKAALFTLVTFTCALLLVRRPEYFSWSSLASGFSFRLPGNGVATAVAVFGITGVGATELFVYPYWCVEKGYARFTGPREASQTWEARARGWIKVMQVDVFASLVLYTLVTVAFYLLGAGILHGMGLVPAATDMIRTLSNIYTQTLGTWSVWLFYLGAVVILYGTVFAATAAHSRLFADMMRLLGLFERQNYPARQRFRRRFLVVLAVVPAVLFLFIQSPVWMVILGGIAQAVMLPIIAIGTLYLRYRHLPRSVVPSWTTTAAVWVSGAVMVFVVGYSLVRQQ
ncbi:MAG: Nramp family divalent metal transporter [Acidobacteria bacterium]|nr:Nramp family divalent metal transporter [Acidobacteriota bacterium]